MTKRLMLAAIAAVVASGIAVNSAKAVPVAHLSADSTQSTITLTVGTALGSGGGTATIKDDWTSSEGDYDPNGPESDFPSDVVPPLSPSTGGLNIGLEQPGLPNLGALTIHEGALDVSNVAFTINVVIASLDAALINVGFSLSDPLHVARPPLTNTGNASQAEATYDLADTLLSLDQGLITYKGTGIASALVGTFDLGAEPLTLAIPAGSIATIWEDTGKNVTMKIPLDVLTTLTTDPIEVKARISGQIILTGLKIPEPGTMVLLGVGLVGLIPVIRKKLRKSA